jgi:hypothetical protein
MIQMFSYQVGCLFLVHCVYNGLVGGIVWTVKEQEE